MILNSNFNAKALIYGLGKRKIIHLGMRSETSVVLRKAVFVMCQLHFILQKFKVQEGARSELGQTPGWFFQWLDH